MAPSGRRPRSRSMRSASICSRSAPSYRRHRQDLCAPHPAPAPFNLSLEKYLRACPPRPALLINPVAVQPRFHLHPYPWAWRSHAQKPFRNAPKKSSHTRNHQATLTTPKNRKKKLPNTQTQHGTGACERCEPERTDGSESAQEHPRTSLRTAIETSKQEMHLKPMFRV
jgi:hypothetical protein